MTLPDELRSLLSESDGIIAEYGESLVWSAARIAQENVMMRTYPDFRQLYMPFDPLLFLGEAGNGDLYGYTVLAGAIRSTYIFTWNHESDSRCWYAMSLADYIRRRLSDE